MSCLWFVFLGILSLVGCHDVEMIGRPCGDGGGCPAGQVCASHGRCIPGIAGADLADGPPTETWPDAGLDSGGDAPLDA